MRVVLLPHASHVERVDQQRTHLRYRVEYLKAGEVVDFYDTENANLAQALIGADWHFLQSKREHGADSLRVLDRETALYHRTDLDPGSPD